MSRRTFESPFGIGDKVRIDGNGGFTGTLTALTFRNENPLAEVSWLADHQSRSAWVEMWRVTLAEEETHAA